jgi:hypothetical protein
VSAGATSNRRPVLAAGRRLGLAALLAAAALAPLAAADTATPRPPSIKDSPGYVPLVDPESSSVTIGRRLNAPAVSLPFRGGARSLEGLGHAVCRALQVSSVDSLRALCVTAEEFREILWREFPQSRPATGLTWEDAWQVLDVRLMSGCNAARDDHGGRRWELVRLECDSTMRYRNFALHSRLTMVVKDDLGQVHRWGWLRAVAERKGRFKIYSTRD